MANGVWRVVLFLAAIFPVGTFCSAQNVHDDGCDPQLPIGEVIAVRGECLDYAPHGHWVINYRAGGKAKEGDFIRGKKRGVWKSWDTKGVFVMEELYPDTGNGHPLRRQQFYHDGTPQSDITFDENGQWQTQTNWDVYGRRTSYPFNR